jgi:hypothetical protein
MLKDELVRLRCPRDAKRRVKTLAEVFAEEEQKRLDALER